MCFLCQGHDRDNIVDLCLVRENMRKKLEAKQNQTAKLLSLTPAPPSDAVCALFCYGCVCSCDSPAATVGKVVSCDLIPVCLTFFSRKV